MTLPTLFSTPDAKPPLELYDEFTTVLAILSAESVIKLLKKCPALATYKPENNERMPPIFYALRLTGQHKNGAEIIDLLKDYKIDFNAECYTHTFESTVTVDCDLNPLAYFILRGGDSRLINKLINCGTDYNHPSVHKITRLIEENPTIGAFEDSDKFHEHDATPIKLAQEMRKILNAKKNNQQDEKNQQAAPAIMSKL